MVATRADRIGKFRLRSLESDAVVSLGGYIVQLALTFCTGVMIARALGPGDYGVLNILRNFYLPVATVATLGLEVALLKYCGGAPIGDRSVERTVLRLRAFAALVNVSIVALVCALSGWLENRFYPYRSFAGFLILTMIALPVQTDLSICGAIYKSRGEAGLYNIFVLYLQSIARLIMVGVAVLIRPTTLVMVIINFLQVAVSALGLFAHERRRRSGVATDATANSRDISDPGWRAVWTVLSVSSWMTVSAFMIGVARSADTLVLGGYVSGGQVGAYAALTAVSQLVQIFPLAASQDLGPKVSRCYHAGDLAGLRRLLDDYLHSSTIVSGFVFAGIAVFGTRLDLVFGHGFEFRPLICFLVPLGYFLSAALAPMGYALSMTGRHRVEFLILALGAIVLVSLCWLLIPSYGQSGAAAAMVVGFAVTNLIRFAYVSKVLGFVPGHARDFAPMFVALAAARVGASLGDRFGGPTFAATGAACLAYAGIYATACYLLLLRTRSEP